MKRIYFDACSLSRSFDDQRQARNRLESEAMVLILARIQERGWVWVASDVLSDEVGRIPEQEKRASIELLLRHALEHVSLRTGSSNVASSLRLEASNLTMRFTWPAPRPAGWRSFLQQTTGWNGQPGAMPACSR